MALLVSQDRRHLFVNLWYRVKAPTQQETRTHNNNDLFRRGNKKNRSSITNIFYFQFSSVPRAYNPTRAFLKLEMLLEEGDTLLYSLVHVSENIIYIFKLQNGQIEDTLHE
jgi:hypothetical protein